MSTSLAVSFAIVFFLISGNSDPAQEAPKLPPKREAVVPRWRTNLRAAIGSAPLGLVVGREKQAKARVSLSFTDDDNIVVTFVTQEGEPTLARRNGPETDFPLRLRGIFLDATNGNVKTTVSWPTESRHASLIASHDGRFITERGTTLTLYSPDLRELTKLQLPQTNDTGWDANSSPTGKTILLVPSGLHTEAIPWVWVNAENLQIVRTWQEIQSGWVGISDDTIAMTTCVWISGCESRIETRSIDSDWKVIATPIRKSRPRPKFVTHDKLILLGPSTTTLLRANGEILFEDRAYGGCWWGQALSSANGQRLVIPSRRVKGAVASLDIGGVDVLKNILVYDLPFRGLSYALDLKGPKIDDLVVLALSPSGRKLAILKSESIELLELPPLGD